MGEFSPDEEILGRLHLELTEDLLHRLLAYAHRRSTGRQWYGLTAGSDAPLAGGKQPKDLVQIAITRTIDGAQNGPGRHRRLWDGRKPLYDYLTSLIDSEVYHLTNSWINERFRRASTMGKISDADRREDFFDRVRDETVDCPEETLLNQEAETYADKFLWGFIDFLGDDEFLVAVVDQIIDGARKPGEIAVALDVPTDKIYAARKRLKRRLSEYRARLAIEKEATNG